MGVLLIFLYGSIEILFDLFEAISLLITIKNFGNFLELVAIFCYAGACMLKVGSVIGGFIAVCMASKGLTDPQKQLIRDVINTTMKIVIIPTIIIYTVFFLVFLKDSRKEDRIFTIYLFLYGVLKSVIYYGFGESLKAYIQNSPKVCESRRFDYLPLTMPEMTYQLPSFTEYSL